MSEIKRTIPSPCVRNCCLNEKDVCLGCFRHLDEITRWTEADDVERCLILEKATARKVAHRAKFSKRLPDRKT